MKQKTMKQRIGFIGQLSAAISAIFLLIMMTACTTQVTQITIPADGRVVMAVTDASADMNNITSIKLTIDKVSFHSDANGWVDVSTLQHTYDLLALKKSASNSLLADLSLAPARYDQMMLDVSSVTITDASGIHAAKMPSNTLRLNGEIVVLSNKTSTVSFDFIADQSLYLADGQYIFAPVIQLESRTDGVADTAQSDNIRLSGGTVQTSSRVGMDTLGNLVVGGSLPPYLQIDENGTISGTENALIPQNMTISGPNTTFDPNSRIAS